MTCSAITVQVLQWWTEEYSPLDQRLEATFSKGVGRSGDYTAVRTSYEVSALRHLIISTAGQVRCNKYTDLRILDSMQTNLQIYLLTIRCE